MNYSDFLNNYLSLYILTLFSATKNFEKNYNYNFERVN